MVVCDQEAGLQLEFIDLLLRIDIRLLGHDMYVVEEDIQVADHPVERDPLLAKARTGNTPVSTRYPIGLVAVPVVVDVGLVGDQFIRGGELPPVRRIIDRAGQGHHQRARNQGVAVGQPAQRRGAVAEDIVQVLDIGRFVEKAVARRGSHQQAEQRDTILYAFHNCNRLKVQFHTERIALHHRVFHTAVRSQLHVPQIEITERK